MTITQQSRYLISINIFIILSANGISKGFFKGIFQNNLCLGNVSIARVYTIYSNVCQRKFYFFATEEVMSIICIQGH